MSNISQNGGEEKDKNNSGGRGEAIKGDVEEAIREVEGLEESGKESRNAGETISGGMEVHQRVDWCIKRLKESQLDIKTIFDSTEVIHLLEGDVKNWALSEGRKRYENWLRKGGEKAPKTGQIDYAESSEKMAIMDYLRRPIMDYYGLTGFDRAKYRNYMNALIKALKGYGPEGYIKRARKLMSKFEVEGEYNEEILHILTVLTLKFLIWYEQQKTELT
jgi:hypothetical protein